MVSWLLYEQNVPAASIVLLSRRALPPPIPAFVLCRLTSRAAGTYCMGTHMHRLKRMPTHMPMPMYTPMLPVDLSRAFRRS